MAVILNKEVTDDVMERSLEPARCMGAADAKVVALLSPGVELEVVGGEVHADGQEVPRGASLRLPGGQQPQQLHLGRG